MDEETKMAAPANGVGFWAGFRLGLGFMAAVALSMAAGAVTLVLVAWLAFGSVRNMAVAAATETAGIAASVGRSTVDGAKAGLADARDRVVEGTGQAVTRAGGAVRDGATSVVGRASDAKDAIRERAGGLVGRLRGRAEEPAATPPEAPKDAAPPAN